jgi:predicted flap endonuclease-1-like 5' DNA nuclease
MLRLRGPLRLDIVFYALGIVCFIFTALIIPLFGVTLLPVAFLIVFLLFGLLFMAFGYSTRPRHYRIIRPSKPPEVKIKEKPPQPPEITETPTAPPPSSPEQATLPELSKPPMELTRIKGIGPKRVRALNALQIVSVEDLAKFSAEELADKLEISSKITAKWVEQAQNLLKEGS